MSSYHEMMVNQVNSDRKRFAAPHLSAGAAREISPADVYEYLTRRREAALATRLQGIRRFAATAIRSVLSVLRRADPVTR